ncbi:MAG: tRNA (adenosine(37)-N6)-dimethylallyltransferase MiaA [Micrococcales bacterium]|nr:tRNA (adenosine(37)-N6)-dimethylallyltransferase MiaA [Micrococcales bacterium]
MSVVIAVVGPTATGKSRLAVELALAVAGEVVNADAFAVYRGMDIGTAKTSAADQRGVTHHLVDVVDPDAQVSVAQYRQAGRTVLDDLAARGKRAVVVGGSGLYVRALLDPMHFPGTDPELRDALEARVEHEGAAALHTELAAVAPEAARAIDPRNVRRVVRALEVYILTGRPPTTDLPRYTYEIPALQIGLELPRDVLDAAIDARVEAMWAAGFVEEVRRLRSAGMSRTARTAVGYAQVLAMLDGVTDEPTARTQTVTATRRLARKQMGWFGRDPRICWLPAHAPDLLDQALALVQDSGDGSYVLPGQGSIRSDHPI